MDFEEHGFGIEQFFGMWFCHSEVGFLMPKMGIFQVIKAPK